MGFKHENRIGEKRRHVDLAPSPGVERKSGEDRGARPRFDDKDLSRTALPEGSLNAMRRRAERRRSSALISLWVDVERRSGIDQRASPSVNDIDEAKRQDFLRIRFKRWME